MVIPILQSKLYAVATYTRLSVNSKKLMSVTGFAFLLLASPY